MSDLSSKLERLNPFARGSDDDDDDTGDVVNFTSLGGGGHAARRTTITTGKLRISNAMRAFLVDHNILSKKDAGLSSDDTKQTATLQALIDKPHIHVPSQLVDRSHPLSEYFISSSHNTYLLAHQLYGKSSAEAYEKAIKTGARCVEIDAWDDDSNPEEPKVTHGYTLVSHISFRAVCETIRDVVDEEAAVALDEPGYRAAPILISLENHCGPHGQLRLVQIMKEVWGERLLSEEVRLKGHHEQDGEHEQVRLDELGAKICVIVEYHLPNEVDEADEAASSSEDEEEKKARETYKEKKKAAASNIIVPELAELGVYAQSVKPADNSWFEGPEMINGPHHQLINVSESQLKSHMPANNDKIARHNALHLMRVYPRGTRITSRNLNPVPFWAVGSQICALNWQSFGPNMQTNEALFSGTDGYVLKPEALRAGGNGILNKGRKRRLRLHVAGASDVPVPDGRDPDDIKPYLTCTLVHPDKPDNAKQKTQHYRHHRLGFLHRGENPPPKDPIWDDVLEWEYEDNDLVFLRMYVKSEESWSRNPTYGIGAVRLLYTTPDWCFIRLLDTKAQETQCTLLVRFELEDL
jgi:phosphatidylinositol phospholipase C delta